jgi:DNA repair protein RecN (Recombination protein N)
MLMHLDIRDLVVVESLDLEFEPGLTVLTGETGAGKSILLTALGLALGDRADSAYIRPGAQRAEINLNFDLVDCPATQNWLRDNELAEDGECLIRRVITVDGRSRAFVNGRPVTLQSLQELGRGLVEIHGQHAHVRLTATQEQRRLLDAKAGNAELVSRIEVLYRDWRRFSDELSRRTALASDRSARLELLRFQVAELEQMDIAGLNYAALIDEHARLANVDRILEVGRGALDNLYEADAHSVNAGLSQAIHALSELGRLASNFNELRGFLEDAQLQVKEAALQLRRELEHLESDPTALSRLDQRLAEVHRLARKHQVRPETLPSLLGDLRLELERLQGGAESMESLRRELGEVLETYAGLSDELSSRRQAAAVQMEEDISGLIRELGMPHGLLKVEVRRETSRDPTSHGRDEIEFLFSANQGMPPRSLARVASGGELSRIGLAIQVAATHGKSVPTLIFDEVDSGIGGGTAEVVGRKLRLLGEDRQVFCVTHLPQVAAQGHNHLLVRKTSRGGIAQSSVSVITGDGRVAEVARMLGGRVITEQTLAHADEMLRLAAGPVRACE